jgi:adenylosuccinate lyase
VQAAGLRAWDEGQDFKALVKADERVRALLSEQEIDDLFDPTWHTRNIDTTYQRLQIGEEK